MNEARWFAVGAIFLGIAVVLGAFGAHALKGKLDTYSLSVFEKATFYHFVHALALLIVPLAAKLGLIPQESLWKVMGLFSFGIVFFSGSLYLLAVTGISILGAITPIGGTAFIIAWGYLAYLALNVE